MRIERKKQIANEFARVKFMSTINKGYTNPSGIVMQCDKRDYEMMESGLDVFLNTPTELGGAGGVESAMVIVRDKYNNPHPMQIVEAKQLALEMKMYYWKMWARKGLYYDSLLSCDDREQMQNIGF